MSFSNMGTEKSHFPSFIQIRDCFPPDFIMSPRISSVEKEEMVVMDMLVSNFIQDISMHTEEKLIMMTTENPQAPFSSSQACICILHSMFHCELS